MTFLEAGEIVVQVSYLIVYKMPEHIRCIPISTGNIQEKKTLSVFNIC